MNIKSILKTVGMGLLSASPFGAAAIPVINALLPDNKKLPASATGNDAKEIIASLPPTEQVKIDLAEINLLVEEERGRTERYVAMASSDGQETRAKIVVKAMNTLIGLSVVFVLATVYVYVTEGAAAAFSVNMAIVYGTITATFAYVVRAYFGDLRNETKSRHQTIDDKPHQPSLLSVLLNKKK